MIAQLKNLQEKESFSGDIFRDFITDFDGIRISIASPEMIRARSNGKIDRPETINYRTLKPEKQGLFCARVFGPVKDFECSCGKYKRIKFKGIVCEKCGVEVTHSRVRRERMGHVELASPVAHIWFSRSIPSRLGVLLDYTTKELERILSFHSYVVTDPGLTTLSAGQLLSQEELEGLQDEHGEDAFTTKMGGMALKILLSQINLEEKKESLLQELDTVTAEVKRKKLVKRLKLVQGFLASGARPEWMILDVIPVIPPELRPLVPLDGGRFATADVNDLYRRLINRNNRLARLYKLKVPQIIIRNEERMLQEIADALFDNSRGGRPILGSNKRPLKSLSDALKGKQGRFRQNLLGKRVDYSGRSVIVVGPHLRLNQCGLPKKMALELFRPFVCHRLEKYGLVPTLKAAKKFVENERPEVWGILEEVVKEHPVLLNRAPTLHRLGIQAFEPILIEDQAIQVHPLVCKAFNADFDGDTMSVHVPLSVESQLEARLLMMSSNNILSPADGSPVIVPSKDMILGLFYLTIANKKPEKDIPLVATIAEIKAMMHSGVLALHDWIRFRSPDGTGNLVDTTPGRLLLFDAFPKEAGISFSLLNKPLVSGEVANLIERTYRLAGRHVTVEVAHQLMQFGFRYSTQSGVSFGKGDLVVPAEKDAYVRETWEKVQEFRQQYLDGLITQGERYNAVTDAWDQCSERVSSAMMKNFSKEQTPLDMNAIYMMGHSGARGSAAQMRQLAAMRGLIAKHSGDILEHPITSNFSEGLKAFEYFNSTHGSRKGLSDMALKTANSGYLTRRLVDVAQDCIITEEDCGTTAGILVSAMLDQGDVVTSLGDRIFGRVLAESIQNESGSEVLKAGLLIDQKALKVISDMHLEAVQVRSVLKCQSKRGLCASCYGLDMALGKKVSVGEAVGVIAAQSIGEPGTQLTLRTFHLGGAAQKGTVDSSLITSEKGTVTFVDAQLGKNSSDQVICTSRTAQIVLLGDSKQELQRYTVPYGAQVFVTEGEKVSAKKKLVEWSPYMIPIVAEKSGTVQFVDLVEGGSFREVVDETTGMPRRTVLDWRQNARGSHLRPRLLLRDDSGHPIVLDNGLEARHFLAVDAQLMAKNGQKVLAGDLLAQLPRESSKVRDITGGLPRIVELVEARKPKDPAVISEIEGTVYLGKDYRTKRAVLVKPLEEGAPDAEYFVPRGKHILVNEGEKVKKGEVLVDGSPVLQDILRVMGIEALAEYLIKEIQEVYRFQGVNISEKHIEIIVRQMIQKVEITDPGGTLYLVGDHVDRHKLKEVNEEVVASGRKPAVGIAVLQSITKASLQTSSFISAASFMETTRVLADAALRGAVDPLQGLKESVISGRLIPAGTGWVDKTLRTMAADQEQSKSEV